MSQSLADIPPVVYGDVKNDEYESDSGDELFADVNRRPAYRRAKRRRSDAFVGAAEYGGSDPFANLPASDANLHSNLGSAEDQPIHDRIQGLIDDLAGGSDGSPHIEDIGLAVDNQLAAAAAGASAEAAPIDGALPSQAAAAMATSPLPNLAATRGHQQEAREAAAATPQRPPTSAAPAAARLANVDGHRIPPQTRIVYPSLPSLGGGGDPVAIAGGITIDEDLFNAANRTTTMRPNQAGARSPNGGGTARRRAAPAASTAGRGGRYTNTPAADRTPGGGVNPLSALLSGSGGGRGRGRGGGGGGGNSMATPRNANNTTRGQSQLPMSRFRQPQLDSPAIAGGPRGSRLGRMSQQQQQQYVQNNLGEEEGVDDDHEEVEEVGDHELNPSSAAAAAAAAVTPGFNNHQYNQQHYQQQHQYTPGMGGGYVLNNNNTYPDDGSPGGFAINTSMRTTSGGTGPSSVQRNFLAGLAPAPARAPLPTTARSRMAAAANGLQGRMQVVLATERAAVDHPALPNAATWIVLTVVRRWQEMGVVQALCRVENAETRGVPQEVVAVLAPKVREGVDVGPGLMLKAGVPWRLTANPVQGAPPLLLCCGAVQNV